MSDTFTFASTDHSAVGAATRILTSRYRDYVTFEDVRQECYLWLFSNYHRAEKWRSELEPEHAQRTLIKALRNAGERYCRSEKAERDGYLPEDEFFYSIPMVRDLLVVSFDPDWMAPRSADLDSVSSGNPASEGGNLMTMVADVRRAFDTLAPHDRALLERVYKDTDSDREIAVLALEWDITTKAADMRVRRVLGRLRAALGGPNPSAGGEK
jgi:DNA-directed RNA polymerase specialized sigma24 family protein